jgi:hypothetical protein
MRSFYRALGTLGLLLGVLLGFAVSVAPPASAARNSSGSYILPAGNPVVSGTSITASWANNTLADIGTELTNSLDRSGRGAMVAPLQLTSGTASSPALTFSSEPSSGLYRAGAGDVRMQVSATQAQRWTTSGSTLPLALTAQGGITATNSTTNAHALTATGNGTGSGLMASGGAGGGAGIIAQGAGVGEGLRATGGATSGTGGSFLGGAPNGAGVSSNGTGTGPGGGFTGGSGGGVGLVAANGISATASARQTALSLTNGDLSLSGVATPNSNVAVSKTLTPKNLITVWAKGTTNGSGGASVLDGFNVTSASIVGSNVRITFASAFANTNYACTFGGEGAVGTHVATGTATTTTIDLRFVNTSTNANIAADATAGVTFSLICTGAQ